MSRTCRSCTAPIAAKSRTGRCARCAWSDPEVRAKKGNLTPEQRVRRAAHARTLSADPAIVARRAAAGAMTNANPVVRARHAEACRVAKERQMADPAYVEKMREAGRTVGKSNLERANMPEIRRRAGETLRRRMLAWCPEHLWEHNAILKRAGYRLAERKQMIATEILREAQRAAEAKRAASDALSVHEQRMERVRQGAKLVPTFNPRRAGPAFTLGGVAPEAM